jgi:hypothetical protein
MLGESQGVAIGIVHVKLARTPSLINRTFVDFLRSVRIPGINVIGRNDNDLTKFAVARVAGEKETIAVAQEHAEGGV